MPKQSKYGLPPGAHTRTDQVQLGLRAKPGTRQRLQAAAAADGLSMVRELEALLDLRDRFDELTRAPHPLGRASST